MLSEIFFVLNAIKIQQQSAHHIPNVMAISLMRDLLLLTYLPNNHNEDPKSTSEYIQELKLCIAGRFNVRWQNS